MMIFFFRDNAIGVAPSCGSLIDLLMQLTLIQRPVRSFLMPFNARVMIAMLIKITLSAQPGLNLAPAGWVDFNQKSNLIIWIATGGTIDARPMFQ
ncbi:MAG: hypothetical protein ACK562_17385, partial [Acidobacteriota bacterium]